MRTAIALAFAIAAHWGAAAALCLAEQPFQPYGESALFPGEVLAPTGPNEFAPERPSPDKHTLIYPWFLDQQVEGDELEGCYGWGRGAIVGVSASGMFLGPDHSSRVLFRDDASPLDLRTTDATLGYDVAPRLVAQAAIGPLGVVEAIYFGVDGWDAQARMNNGPFTQSSLLGFDASDVTDLRVFSSAELHSFESNIRFYDAPVGWGVLVGARYIEEREMLKITDRFFNRQGVDGGDSFRFTTDNQLLGLQVGMDMAVEEGPWRLDARLKAGVFGNDCRRTGMAEVPGIGTGEASFDVEDTRAAFLGEFNITGAYYVTPYVAVTLGYQLMLFEGLAVASEQLEGPDARGNPVFNGGLVGIEAYR